MSEESVYFSAVADAVLPMDIIAAVSRLLNLRPLCLLGLTCKFLQAYIDGAIAAMIQRVELPQKSRFGTHTILETRLPTSEVHGVGDAPSRVQFKHCITGYCSFDATVDIEWKKHRIYCRPAGGPHCIRVITNYYKSTDTGAASAVQLTACMHFDTTNPRNVDAPHEVEICITQDTTTLNASWTFGDVSLHFDLHQQRTVYDTNVFCTVKLKSWFRGVYADEQVIIRKNSSIAQYFWALHKLSFQDFCVNSLWSYFDNMPMGIRTVLPITNRHFSFINFDELRAASATASASDSMRQILQRCIRTQTRNPTKHL